VSHTWERIEGHTCGEWRLQADQEIAQTKAKLERYVHFYQHYSVRLICTCKLCCENMCSIACRPLLSVGIIDQSNGDPTNLVFVFPEKLACADALNCARVY
jgi:hypothetical protein